MPEKPAVAKGVETHVERYAPGLVHEGASQFFAEEGEEGSGRH
jgi:hypothetical protein